jgi:hypothetical protein
LKNKRKSLEIMKELGRTSPAAVIVHDRAHPTRPTPSISLAFSQGRVY